MNKVFFSKLIFNLFFQVHENGLISFGSTLKDQTPASFPLTNKAYAAAPYWADVYTERGGRVWYRKTTNDAIVSLATRDVIRAFPRYTGFMARWVVIVTWNEVTFYAASGVYTQNVSYRPGLWVLAKCAPKVCTISQALRNLKSYKEVLFHFFV